MISVIAELSDGRTSIVVEGHEEHLEDGRVCAAVSAIAHTALLGLEEIAQQHPTLVTFNLKENP